MQKRLNFDEKMFFYTEKMTFHQDSSLKRKKVSVFKHKNNETGGKTTIFDEKVPYTRNNDFGFAF